jgi:hypothetical protein
MRIMYFVSILMKKKKKAENYKVFGFRISDFFKNSGVIFPINVFSELRQLVCLKARFQIVPV